MSTRNGKIARLGATIREELNLRLYNGQEGKLVVDWLNEQDSVQQVLAEGFEGKAISEQNLSEWRQGGYGEWEARKELLDRAKDMVDYGEQMEECATDEFVEKLTLIVSARYGQLLMEWNGEPTEEIKEKLGVLEKLNRSVLALQRGTHRAARLAMAEQRQEWAEFEFEKKLAELERKLRDREEHQRSMLATIRGMKERGEWNEGPMKSDYAMDKEQHEMRYEGERTAHEEQLAGFKERMRLRAKMRAEREKSKFQAPQSKPTKTRRARVQKRAKSEGIKPNQTESVKAEGGKRKAETEDGSAVTRDGVVEVVGGRAGLETGGTADSEVGATGEKAAESEGIKPNQTNLNSSELKAEGERIVPDMGAGSVRPADKKPETRDLNEGEAKWN